jgi:hypothetical protein
VHKFQLLLLPSFLMPDSRVQIAGCILQGAINCLLSFPFKGKGAEAGRGSFAPCSDLPRLPM